MVTVRCYLPILAMLFVSVSCAPYKAPAPMEELPQTFTVPSERWTAKKVSLSCPTSDCPDGVGMILFSKLETVPNKGHRFTMSRCTATFLDNQQVLTNAHCVLPDWDTVYFFYRVGDKTQFRLIGDNVDWIKDPSFGRDLSLWTLQEPIHEIHGVALARETPKRMPRVTAFVVNGLPSPEKAERFVIEKRECTTRPRVPIIDAGFDDHTTSLALFGCEIRHGNSGSPVFASSDFSKMESLINSIWNFDPKVEPLGQAYDWLFVNHAPEYLNHFFALSERLHCLPIQDQVNPPNPCPHPASLNARLQPVIAKIIDSAYRAHPEPSSGVVWGVRPRLAKIRLDGITKIGLEMVPHPICVKPGQMALNPLPPSYFVLGLNKDNQMGAVPALNVRLAKEDASTLTFPSLTGPLKTCGPFDYVHDQDAAKNLPSERPPSAIEASQRLTDQVPRDL